MMSDDEKEFDYRESGDETDTDPDTNLILDYLSNKLDPEDVEALEQRAKKDKDFRYKLADIVLLKGLVMLALEKNPGPEARECRQTQRLFLDYLKGRASVEKTAQLSRHLDDCFECELAFERFQEHEGKGSERGRWGGLWGRMVTPGRHTVIAGLVVAALAAGAFGVMGFLSSAGSLPSSSRPGAAPGGQPAATTEFGLIARPDLVQTKLEEVLRQESSVDGTSEAVREIVEAILDPTQRPVEREQNYAKLAGLGARFNPVLWLVAEHEPISAGREAIYRALQITEADWPALIAAFGREADANCHLRLRLLAMMQPWNETFAAAIRAYFADRGDRKDQWSGEVLRRTYGKMRGDPAMEERMTAYLRPGVGDGVRALAAQGAIEAGNLDAMPVAFELLGSKDKDARLRAALTIARSDSRADLEKLAAMDWSIDTELGNVIVKELTSKGIPVPISKKL